MSAQGLMMVGRTDRDLALGEAERASGGLTIDVRLRIALDLLLSLAEEADASHDPAALSTPRGPKSRLHFERIAVTPSGQVYATGPGDASGAGLVVWEIVAGRPLGSATPHRLHDEVDDMPADVDDLLMTVLDRRAEPLPLLELTEELRNAGETYAASTVDLIAVLWSASASAELDAVFADDKVPPVRTVVPPPTSRAAASRRASLLATPPSQTPPVSSDVATQRSPHRRSSSPPPNGAARGALTTSKTLTAMPAVAAPLPQPLPAESTRLPRSSRKAPMAAESQRRVPSSRSPRSADDSDGPTLISPSAPIAGAPSPPAVAPASAKPDSAPIDSYRPDATILLIHGGDQAPLLADALRGVGYEVIVRRDAASGFAQAVARNPICILCDSDLPDADGESVVRRLRSHKSAVAHTPFMLLASRADTRKRIARFGAGADVCLMKPIRPSVMIKQVDALVDMASRLRAAHRAVSVMPQVSSSAACAGDIRQVGIGVMLTIFEMERRSGIFAANVGAIDHRIPSGRVTLSDLDSVGRLELELASGCIAGASSMGVPAPALDVVRAMLRLADGRFVFKPTKARYVDAPRLSEILAEAARLEDEAGGMAGRPRA